MRKKRGVAGPANKPESKGAYRRQTWDQRSRPGWAMLSGSNAFHYYRHRLSLCGAAPMRTWEAVAEEPAEERIVNLHRCAACAAKLAEVV